MGIFSTGSVEPSLETVFENPNALLELFIVDEVSQLTDEKIQEFCKPGGVGETLVSEGVMKNKTLVRLSKKDDLSRRAKMAALRLAEEAGDQLWDKLVKNRIKERELIGKIVQKYGTKGEKVAKKQQQEFLHGKGGKGVLPKSFMKAGGAERTGE